MALFDGHLASLYQSSNNPNLLINGDFRINQRGVYAMDGSKRRYTYDRWYVSSYPQKSDGSVIPSSHKGVFFSAFSLYDLVGQDVEDSKSLNGKTVTVSCETILHEGSFVLELYDGDALLDNILINGTPYVESVAGTGKDPIYPDTADYTTLTIKKISISNTLRVVIGCNRLSTNKQAGITIHNVKLEIGDTATPFLPRPYAEELKLCQRYYCELNEQAQHLALIKGNVSGSTSAGRIARAVIQLPAPMRTMPDITYIVKDPEGLKAPIINDTISEGNTAFYNYRGVNSEPKNISEVAIDAEGCDSNPDKIVLDLTVPGISTAINNDGIFCPSQRMGFDAEIY